MWNAAGNTPLGLESLWTHKGIDDVCAHIYQQIIPLFSEFMYFKAFLQCHSKIVVYSILLVKVRKYQISFVTSILPKSKSLTIAIIFELFYYINGYFRVYLTDIHEYSSKMPCLPIISINFSWAKSHNCFIMEKSKFTLLFNIC